MRGQSLFPAVRNAPNLDGACVTAEGPVGRPARESGALINCQFARLFTPGRPKTPVPVSYTHRTSPATIRREMTHKNTWHGFFAGITQPQRQLSFVEARES